MGIDPSLGLWPQILDKIKAQVSEQNFSAWLSPIACLEISQEKILLGLPDQFLIDWVRDHYEDLIASVASAVLGTNEKPSLSFEIFKAEKEEGGPTATLPSIAGVSAAPPVSMARTALSSLNQVYTFDNFVVGSGNRFAQAAAFAVAESPAKRYNPLFIYGSVGLGKTHLMQAIAHALMSKNREAKALYLSSEKFVNQLVQAIQTRTQIQFRNRYRNLDILLIDDIHFIAGKEATQEEFFHTFNSLHDEHKQIVISSDRPPKDIPGLEERLVSRFQWGLVVDIQPPDFETRLAILQKKVQRENTRVPGDVLELIADKIKSNVRELEGSLARVIAFSELTNTTVYIDMAKDILKDSLLEEIRKITIDLIQKKTAEYYDISISDMRIKRRSKTIAFPRQVAMYLARELTDHSLPEIGQYFGGRDHTTVLHAYNKITKDMAGDINIKKTVEFIKNSLTK